MSDYASFKTKMLALIDVTLSQSQPIPADLIAEIDATKDVGCKETHNSIGELVSSNPTKLMRDIAKYNAAIATLCSTREIIERRTEFGWILATKSMLLWLTDDHIGSIKQLRESVMMWIAFVGSQLKLTSIIRSITDECAAKQANTDECVAKQDKIKEFKAKLQIYIKP